MEAFVNKASRYFRSARPGCNAGIIATLVFCLSAMFSFAQTGLTIKGIAADTASKIKLQNTTIYVLNAKDSILCNFAYTGADGTFVINSLSAGNYILLATYPDYADYVEYFTLDAAHTPHNFGNINMQLKARLLQEVIIKGAVTAIKIKGDTTEFNARAYVIQPNDKVEDLLKQLPGIQVDKDGKITANGEKVSKVLLDGEEFFGDDPTLITKNIRADMVDKIQLYDKKSDQAAFTGIDDGVKIKTINVKLKEDKKTGLFGKADGGIGSNGYYEAQAMYNSFKPKQKYAAYGTDANTGKISLGQLDNNALGASGNSVQVGDVIVIPPAVDEQEAVNFNGTYNGNGLPLAQSGGLHYDGKFDDGSQLLNTNYKAGSLGINGAQNTSQQQTLPSGTINANTDRHFSNTAFRQKLDAAYQVKLDTASNLKVTADATLKNTQSQNDYLTTSRLGTLLLNQNAQSSSSRDNQQVFDGSAFYTHRFKTPRRTFSWVISEAYNQNQTKGYQNSEVDFYNALGVKDSSQHINQYKTTHITSSVLTSNATWSEPLSKAWSAVANYGLGLNNTSADRQSFDQSAPGQYDILNAIYSNNYQFNQLTNQLGAIVNYRQNKTTLNFGTKISDVDFKQLNEYTGNLYKRSFINWAPQASYLFRPSQQASFSINYNGATMQPTIDEIQPVRVNTNPLNITLGNAYLRPAFNNNLRLNYRAYHPITGTSFILAGNLSFKNNSIINNVFTDSAGKTTTQYVNLTGHTPLNYFGDADINVKIQPIDVSIEIELNTSGAIGYSYINNQLDRSVSYNYSGMVELKKTRQKAYYFQLVLAPGYSVNRFSLQQQSNNNAATMYSDGVASVYLPAGFQVQTDYGYNYKVRTQAFDAQQRTIWNAGFSKTFLKGDNLKLSLNINDILNQNTNFSRSISANAITQSSYSGIRRYWMCSLTWDFTKFGKVAAKN